MIYTQEISENTYHDFDKLPNKVKKALFARKCEQCGKALTQGTQINYVVTEKGRVVWWHNHYK